MSGKTIPVVWLAGHLPVVGVVVTATDVTLDSGLATFASVGADFWLGRRWPLALMLAVVVLSAACALAWWMFRRLVVLALPPQRAWVTSWGKVRYVVASPAAGRPVSRRVKV